MSQEITDIVPGEIHHIDSVDTQYGFTKHTVRFTDDTTGQDTTGVWEETQGEHTTGWGHNEKTSKTTTFTRVL